MPRHSNYPGGFSGGVTVRGMPILNSYGGKVIWVDSTASSTGTKGTFDRPVLSVNTAMNLCTANNGDIVMLKPGHTEDLDAATDVVVDVAGVAIIGLGGGAARPTFTYSGTAGSFEVDAANTTIQNVLFKTSVSAAVVGVNVDAANCVFEQCEWNFDATGDDFLIFVDCEDVAGTEFLGCRFISEDLLGSNEAIRLDNADNTRIVGNHFFGKWANGAIWSDTTGDTGDGSTVCTHLLISENQIYNSDTVNGIAVQIDNPDTGIISYNALSGPTGGTVAALLDPGSCMCIENYGSNIIDASGVLIPSTTAT